jgi:hypothetical protein
MEWAASIEEKPKDLIVCPASGAEHDDRLAGLLNTIGLAIQSKAGGAVQGAVATSRTSAWIAEDQDAHALAELAETHPDARFLLFFETAADYLAHLLAKGERPEDHFNEWSRSAGRLLAFVRRHRGRSMLVDYRSALANPGALAVRCRQFGIALAEPLETTDSAQDDFEAERWLIGEWLNGRDEFDTLAAELEASAHPLVDEIERSVPSIGNRVAAYADRMSQHQAALDAANKEAEELRDEVRRVTEQLAIAEADQRAEAELKQQQAEKDELVEENELLLLQLHQVQEELETYFLENQRLRETGADPSTTTPAPKSAEPGPLKPLKPPSAEQKRSMQKPTRWSRRAERKKLKKEIKLISESEWFDGAWYLETYPDVAEAGMDPAEHYLRFGAAEGRNPSRRFNTNGYLTMHYDVRADGMNPLLHYLRYGKDEGRALPPEWPAW